MMVRITFILTDKCSDASYKLPVYIKQHCSPSGGLTPLHTAVMSHNGAIKEQRCLENPCSYVTGEMVQKRRMFVECIKTLLIMGASYGAKVTNYLRLNSFFKHFLSD